jgi:hypothetical protein
MDSEEFHLLMLPLSVVRNSVKVFRNHGDLSAVTEAVKDVHTHLRVTSVSPRDC